jgi:hypothetical protein
VSEYPPTSDPRLNVLDGKSGVALLRSGPGPPPVARNVHQNRPTGAERARQVGRSRTVVLNVLQHVERRDEVEGLRLESRERADFESNSTSVGGGSGFAARVDCISVNVYCRDRGFGIEVCEPVDKGCVFTAGIEDG